MEKSENNQEKKDGLIPNRVVLITSGGMDSTTLLYRLINEKKDVFTLSFDYGQKHKKELDCAKMNSERFGLIHKIIDLSMLSNQGIFADSSLTTDINVPEGHYAAENMKNTVVHNRNMIMLSIAIAYALSIKASAVYYGAHSGDHAIYPDCRPIFVERMKAIAEVCDYNPIKIETPYLNYTKGDIVKEGIKLKVDYKNTWTCYNGREKACGKCGSCTERLEAFAENNIEDPLEYE